MHHYDHESYAAAGAQQNLIPVPLTLSLRLGKAKNVARVFLQEEQVKLESYIKQNMNLSTFGIYLCHVGGFGWGTVFSALV